MALSLNCGLPVLFPPANTLLPEQIASRLTQITGQPVRNLSNPEEKTQLILSIAKKHQQSDQQQPFYIMDLGELARLLKKWNENLPGVRPFYAVKCNDNLGLIASLAALGVNFDCASPAEIDKILALGVSGGRIVDANACKSESHIRYAKQAGVNLTTFDSIEELNKIKRCHPQCNLLLRLKVNDESSWRPLGFRFGALPEDIVPLLMHARQAGLNVVGVSFHVGSKATQAGVYGEAIAAAKSVFDAAATLGMPRLNILNIGGGFAYNNLFDDISATLKNSIKEHFSEEEEALEIMAEPGRFFAETPFTLVANVIGKRRRGEKMEYTIDEGKYGSISLPLQDRESTTMKPLLRASKADGGSGNSTYLSTIFGPTCDAYDIVAENRWLPELHINDLIVFDNMGSYTSALGTKFNGFDTFAMATYFTLTNL